MAKGSITKFSKGIPYFSTVRRIFSVITIRSCAVAGMPVSSFGSAMIAAPCRLISGSINSIRSSSPVMLFTSALPSYASSPAWSASIIEESMQIGISVMRWIILTAAARSAGSSVSGTPIFTSRRSAPPAICVATSMAMPERSPARSCA